MAIYLYKSTKNTRIFSQTYFSKKYLTWIEIWTIPLILSWKHRRQTGELNEFSSRWFIRRKSEKEHPSDVLHYVPLRFITTSCFQNINQIKNDTPIFSVCVNMQFRCFHKTHSYEVFGSLPPPAAFTYTPDDFSTNPPSIWLIAFSILYTLSELMTKRRIFKEHPRFDVVFRRKMTIL